MNKLQKNSRLAVGLASFLVSVAVVAGEENQLYVDGFESPEIIIEPASCPEDYTPSLPEGAIVDWQPMFGKFFPGPKFGIADNQSVPRGKYLSVRFTTDESEGTGAIQLSEQPGSGHLRRGTISLCSGEFDVSDKCKQSFGISKYLYWTTEGHPLGCPLEPNTTYYLNITFTDGFDTLTEPCSKPWPAPCATDILVSNQGYNP